MKRRVPGSLSRKEFLQAFATLVAYSAPAVLILQPLGCSSGTGTTILPGQDGGDGDCSVSGSSISCSSASDNTSCSVSGTSLSC